MRRFLAILLSVTCTLAAAEFQRHGQWVSGPGSAGQSLSVSTMGSGEDKRTELRVSVDKEDCKRLWVEGALELPAGARAIDDVRKFTIVFRVDEQPPIEVVAQGRADPKSRMIFWGFSGQQEFQPLSRSMFSGSQLRFMVPFGPGSQESAYGQVPLNGFMAAYAQMNAACAMAKAKPSTKADYFKSPPSSSKAEELCRAYILPRADHPITEMSFTAVTDDGLMTTLKGFAISPADPAGPRLQMSCYLYRRDGGLYVRGVALQPLLSK